MHQTCPPLLESQKDLFKVVSIGWRLWRFLQTFGLFLETLGFVPQPLCIAPLRGFWTKIEVTCVLLSASGPHACRPKCSTPPFHPSNVLSGLAACSHSFPILGDSFFRHQAICILWRFQEYLNTTHSPRMLFQEIETQKTFTFLLSFTVSYVALLISRVFSFAQCVCCCSLYSERGCSPVSVQPR